MAKLQAAEPDGGWTEHAIGQQVGGGAPLFPILRVEESGREGRWVGKATCIGPESACNDPPKRRAAALRCMTATLRLRAAQWSLKSPRLQPGGSALTQWPWGI